MQKTTNFLIAALFMFAAIACNNSQSQQTGKPTDSTKTTVNTSKAKIEVMYFHATNRCPTCNAVEKNAIKVLAESYKTKMENGTIKFSSYNIDDEINKPLVEKYQISYSTLLLINSDGTKTDLTDLAFQYARTNPEKYAEILKAEINKQLNK